MGALPNLHGLGADGIKNVEASSLPSSFVLLTTDHFNLFKIVLADGTLTSANANKNADLYRALKGGGSNFGTSHSIYIEASVKWKVLICFF